MKSKDIVYAAFGFMIMSDFPLPELPRKIGENRTAEVLVKRENLSELWADMAEADRYFSVKRNVCMFEIKGVAIFKIENGNVISVSPELGADEERIRLYILGTCMGAILLQRNILPLHGSAVVIEGKAYAVVGDSGAGKSTLALALLKKGYQLIGDDIISVSLSEKNTPVVTPAYPYQKLWQESLQQFGMSSVDYKPIINRDTKFSVPITDQFADKPMPLAGIFELMKTGEDDIEFKPIPGLERMHTVFKHTYRNFFIARSGLMEWHFDTSATIVNQLIFYRLLRPETRFTADHLADMILSKSRKGVDAV